MRLRDVAASIGVTERAVQVIVADLENAGYLTRTRVGRPLGLVGRSAPRHGLHSARSGPQAAGPGRPRTCGLPPARPPP
jgi:hypothetical protein